MNIVAVSQANGEWFNALLELTQAYVDEMVAGIQQHLPNMDLESFIHLHGYHDLRQKYVDPGGNRIGFSWLVLDPEPQACISLAALEPGIAEVRALFVHPDGRNKGLPANWWAMLYKEQKQKDLRSRDSIHYFSCSRPFAYMSRLVLCRSRPICQWRPNGRPLSVFLNVE